ncbi:MAG: KTSC domain-containing protein [Pedobacter sp.]
MPSSVVAKMSYNPESNNLTIVYTSGSVYVYKEVPYNVYISMRAAKSKGKFLNEMIKGKYEFEPK